MLNPAVLARAFSKLRTRLSEQPNATADRLDRLAKETDRLTRELARLSAALASGAETHWPACLYPAPQS
jgi:hypothetical protein